MQTRATVAFASPGCPMTTHVLMLANIKSIRLAAVS
jgi:hypothetical protein